MSNNDWPVRIKDLKKNTTLGFMKISKNKAYIYYPVFLIYAVTLIGLAKFIEIIF